jgi:hypothetical protein
MTRYRYLDISLNIFVGLLFIASGLPFLLFRIFPDHIHVGFIICPTIQNPVPNCIAGGLLLVSSVFVFKGYLLAFAFGFVAALFFSVMDTYWYFKTMKLAPFLPGIIGGLVGTGFFACKLYLRGKMRQPKELIEKGARETPIPQEPELQEDSD